MDKFEAIKSLAVQLNEARLAANAIDLDGIASQKGAYGMIANALIETLAYLVGQESANQAYDALLDGATIEDVIG